MSHRKGNKLQMGSFSHTFPLVTHPEVINYSPRFFVCYNPVMQFCPGQLLSKGGETSSRNKVTIVSFIFNAKKAPI